MRRMARGLGWRNWGYLMATLISFGVMQWGDPPGLGPEHAPVGMTALMFWLIGTAGFLLGNLVDLVLVLLQRRRTLPAIIGLLLPGALVAIAAALV